MGVKGLCQYADFKVLKNADFEVPNITILDPSKTLHKIYPQNPLGNTLEIPFKKLLSEHMKELVKVQVWQLTKFDMKPASDLESNYWYPTFRAGLCATLIFGDIVRPSVWGHIEPVGIEPVS